MTQRLSTEHYICIVPALNDQVAHQEAPYGQYSFEQAKIRQLDQRPFSASTAVSLRYHNIFHDPEVCRELYGVLQSFR